MYNIGEKIAYPMHGAGIVDDIEEKKILGEIHNYYVLNVPYGNVKIMIPVEKSDEIGVRPIVRGDEVVAVIDVLKAESTPMPNNWNKRHRQNMDKLKTGEIVQVAEVVRNLTRIDKEKSLSTGEKKVLNNAKQILISELMLARDMEQQEVEVLVEESI